tara:strand:- start:996 stop:1169 length:174 start_codon:yes stop_codon:yes gene_type:complete
MRSKEERRALHTTPQKTIRGQANSANYTRIVQDKGKIYQEQKIDGQVLFSEVKTSKE